MGGAQLRTAGPGTGRQIHDYVENMATRKINRRKFEPTSIVMSLLAAVLVLGLREARQCVPTSKMTTEGDFGGGSGPPSP